MREEYEDETKGQKAQLGYQTGIRLVGLVSSEIYSRFNTMLTANSIIVAIVGWTLLSQDNLAKFLAIFLPFIGLILCFLWFNFIRHGVYWQTLFRNEAIRLEKKYFHDTFKLISLVTTEDLRNAKKPRTIKRTFVRWFNFYRISTCVIVIFVIIYLAIIFYHFFQFVN